MRVLTPHSLRSRELLVGSLTSPSYGSTALIGYERAFLALKHRLTTVTCDSSQEKLERYAADRATSQALRSERANNGGKERKMLRTNGFNFNWTACPK